MAIRQNFDISSISMIVIIGIFMGLSFLIAVLLSLNNVGYITITQDYYDDYSQCSYDLEKCQQSIKPECAPCTCQSPYMSATGVIFLVVLGILIIFNFIKERRLDKKELELKDREMNINAKEKNK